MVEGCITKYNIQGCFLVNASYEMQAMTFFQNFHLRQTYVWEVIFTA